ncbi:MAG: hypothetical protein R3Y06_11985 [Faecalibacterium sp.]
MLNKEKRSVDEKEAINSIRFLAKSRKLWAIALALVIILLIVVGAVYIGGVIKGQALPQSLRNQPRSQKRCKGFR